MVNGVEIVLLHCLKVTSPAQTKPTRVPIALRSASTGTKCCAKADYNYIVGQQTFIPGGRRFWRAFRRDENGRGYPQPGLRVTGEIWNRYLILIH